MVQRRWKDGTQQDVPNPVAFKFNNKFMSTIDLTEDAILKPTEKLRNGSNKCFDVVLWIAQFVHTSHKILRK